MSIYAQKNDSQHYLQRLFHSSNNNLSPFGTEIPHVDRPRVGKKFQKKLIEDMHKININFFKRGGGWNKRGLMQNATWSHLATLVKSVPHRKHQKWDDLEYDLQNYQENYSEDLGAETLSEKLIKVNNFFRN